MQGASSRHKESGDTEVAESRGWDVPTEGVCNPRFICSQGIPAHFYPVLAWDCHPGFAQSSSEIYLETFLLYSSVKGPLIPNPAYFLWDDSWLSGQSRSKDTRVSLKMFPAGCVSPFESHPGKPGNLFTRKKLLGYLCQLFPI